jgi:hypothetical protein
MPRVVVSLDVGALELARVRLGLYRAEVAKCAGISKSSVHRAFAHGRAGLHVARRITAVLGVDLADVLLGCRGRRLSSDGGLS